MSTIEPRLWFTSMSGDPLADNPRELLEPILPYLDGTIWVLNDVAPNTPAACYLEGAKGKGRIIYRSFTPRHWHLMNETLFTGLMEEGDLVLYCDDLERPMVPFVSRIKNEIGPMMEGSDIDLIVAWGKPYLFRYRETLEYRNSPHWSLHGWNERSIEWSTIEPDETKVRFNVRPLKRKDEMHWVGHYLKYMIVYPAGSNHAALGIERWGGDQSKVFRRREANRLAFRHEMKRRGFPLTVDGFVTMCKDPVQMDDTLKTFLNSDKTFSDGYWHFVKGQGHLLRDTHRPSDALPIP